MADERFPIALRRGLYTSVSPQIAPEGSLVRAVNTTYAPGDVAPRGAPGRRKAGGGGHGATRLAAVSWDRDLEPGNPRRSELVYDAGGGTQMRTVEGAPIPDAPSLDPLNSRSLDPANTGDLDLEAVACDSENYLLSGDKIVAIERGAAGEKLFAPKPPNQMIVARVELRLSGATLVPEGTFFYCFEWYDSQRDRGGSADPSSVTPPGTFVFAYGCNRGSIVAPPPSNVYGHNIYVQKSLWDVAVAALPPQVDRVRVYRTAATTTGSPFPAKFFLIEDRTIASVTTVAVLGAISTTNIPGYPNLVLPNTLPAGEYLLLVGVDGTAFYTTGPFALEARPPYPTVAVSLNGFEARTSRDADGPRASTGAVFGGCLVTDDIDNPHQWRFSYPGRYSSFPGTFFGNINSPESDEIRAIRTLRGRCGFFSKNGVQRLNYLPTATDLNFAEGRLLEGLTPDGIVSRRAVAECAPAGNAGALVWLSRKGLRITHTLYEAAPWSSHVKLSKLMGDPNNWASAILVDDPEAERLWLYFNPDGGVSDRALLIHYSPEHIMPSPLSEVGLPAITGPVMRPGGVRQAVLATLADGTRRVVTASESGDLAYEALGYLDECDEDPVPLEYDMATRKLYIVGKGHRAETTRLLVSASNGGATVDFDATVLFGHGEDVETAAPVLVDGIAPAGDTLLLYDAQGVGEYAQVELRGQCADLRFNELLLDWVDDMRAQRRSERRSEHATL